MANKQQISFALAFLALAIILLTGQATARRELLHLDVEINGNANPTLEMVLNELISGTQRAKVEVTILGNNQMVDDCDKAYAMSLDNLNKAMGMVKGTAKDTRDLKATILEALHSYEKCDYSYAKSTMPSPFIPNNAELTILGAKCLELTSNQANNN
ncbi:hypothetical protein REPUB_Repub01dG0091700 [Reevesia pubescens]